MTTLVLVQSIIVRSEDREGGTGGEKEKRSGGES